MNVTDNTIFIAGTTSGIGLGLARRFQAAGNRVIVGCRRNALLEQIAADYPGIETVAIDAADPDSIASAAVNVLARFPDLNVLVTMAGIMEPENVHNAHFLSVAERTVATNLLGLIRLIAAFTEALAANRTPPSSPCPRDWPSCRYRRPRPTTPTKAATCKAAGPPEPGVQLASSGLSV